MAWTVDVAFKQFHDAINLAGDHRSAANVRKEWLAARLGSSFTVLESFAFGSIPKYTALSEYADLDILVALHYGRHIKDRKPSLVLADVKNALGTSAGATRRNGQAVTVRFSSWPNVDVVPAARVVDDDGNLTGYSIPDANQETWLHSRPTSHAKRIADSAAKHGPNFRQIIKMIKDWNRRQSVQLQSYHIEAIAVNGAWDWSDYSWAVFQFLKDAQSHLSWMWYDDGEATSYLHWSRRGQVEKQLKVATDHAHTAWYQMYSKNDHRAAISEWRRIFGLRFPSYG